MPRKTEIRLLLFERTIAEVDNNIPIKRNNYFLRFNVDHISVRDALKKNIKQLKILAAKSLKYFAIDEVPENQKYYISDEYKQKVLNGVALDTLVDIILNRPIIYLECTSNNTNFNIQRIESRPIGIIYLPVNNLVFKGNLIFCRDQ